MSGSGPIYEYQRELTAKLEQVMRERDEARACLAFERVTVAELRAEVERLRADNADLLSRLDAAAFAVKHGIREVAEKQREACANYLHVWRYDPSKGARSWDECDAVRATPLVTEDEK